MNIQHLEEFLAIVSNLNFSDVANQFYISQSTLSRHVQSLERELCVQLFDRSKQKVTLTPSGEAIIPFAKQLLKSYRQITQAAASSGDLSNKRLSILIGITSYAMTNELYDLVKKFSNWYPDISFKYIEDNKTHLEEMLETNELDFAFIRHPYNGISDTLRNCPNWYNDRFVAALPSSHPLAREDSISLTQLSDEDFIVQRDHFLIIDTLNIFCPAVGFRPHIIAKNKSMDLVMNMVASGDGVTLVSSSDIERLSHENVVFVDISPEINVATFLKCSTRWNNVTAVCEQLNRYLLQHSDGKTF